jgi:hypothetical protein
MSGRTLGWAIALAAAIGVAAWLLRGGEPARRGAFRPPPSHEPAGGEPAPVPEPAADVPEAPDPDLAGLTAPEQAAGAAARLRARLRNDAEALRGAERMLLDPATPSDLRIALAVVLGTIGDSDATLLDALGRFREDSAFARAALLALGATREPPDDDEVFDLGDRPWGVRVGALGITVRRTIDDAATRSAIAAGLSEAGAEVRLAAAQALRHSVANEDARAALLGNIDREREDDVAVETGEALAGWAASAAAADRRDVVRRLLARAGDEGLDGFRFRLEDDLSRVALPGEERAALEAYAQPSRPLSVRAFALGILAGSAERSDAVAGTRALLEHVSDADRDRAVRDLATRLLSRLPYDPGTAAHLARLARDDPEWSIRHSSLDALASFGGKREVLEALAAAAADPDERVAARARELYAKLAR